MTQQKHTGGRPNRCPDCGQPQRLYPKRLLPPALRDKPCYYPCKNVDCPSLEVSKELRAMLKVMVGQP
jgi:hypothetical protein